jgi:hypothetical protein
MPTWGMHLKRLTQQFSKNQKNNFRRIKNKNLTRKTDLTKLPTEFEEFKTPLPDTVVTLSNQNLSNNLRTKKLTEKIRRGAKEANKVILLSNNPQSAREKTNNTLDIFAGKKTETLSEESLYNQILPEVNNQFSNSESQEFKIQLSGTLTDSIFLHNALKQVIQEPIVVKGEILKQIVSNTIKTIKAQKNVTNQESILSIEESKQEGLELTKPEQESVQTAIDLITKTEERAKHNGLTEPLEKDPELENDLNNFQKENNISGQDIIVETMQDVIEQKESDLGSEFILQNYGFASIKLDSESTDLITQNFPETKAVFEKGSTVFAINPETNNPDAIIHTDPGGDSTIIIDILRPPENVPEDVNNIVNEMVKKETEKALKEIPTIKEIFEAETFPEKKALVETESGEIKKISEAPEKEGIQIEELPEEELVTEKSEIAQEQIKAIEQAAEEERQRVETLQQEAQKEIIERFSGEEKKIDEVNIAGAKPGEPIIEEVVPEKGVEPVQPEQPSPQVTQAKQIIILEKEIRSFQTISKKNIRILEQQSDVFDTKRSLDTQTETKITRPEKSLLNDTIETLKNQHSEILQDAQKKIEDVMTKPEIKPDQVEQEIEHIKKETGERLTESVENTHDVIEKSEIKSELAKAYANDTASLITDTSETVLDTIVDEGKNTFDYIRLQDKNVEPEVAKQILTNLKERLGKETTKYKKIVNQLTRMRTREKQRQTTQEKETTEEARNTQKALLAALVTTITTIVTTIAVNNYLKDEVEELKELVSQAEELTLMEQEITEEKPKEVITAISEPIVEEKGEQPKKLIPKMSSHYMPPLINQFAETKNKVVPIAIDTPQELQKIPRQTPTFKRSQQPTFQQPAFQRPTQEFTPIDYATQDAFENRYYDRQQNNINRLNNQLENTERKVEEKLENIEKKTQGKLEDPDKKYPSISDYKKMSDKQEKTEDEKGRRAFEKTTGRPDYHGFDYGYDFDDSDYNFFDDDFNFDSFDLHDDLDDFDFLSKFDFGEDMLDFGRKKAVQKEELSEKPGFDQIGFKGEFDMPEKVTQKRERKTERIRQSEIREEAPEIKQETAPFEEEEIVPRESVPTYKTYLAPALVVITIGCAILFYFLM